MNAQSVIQALVRRVEEERATQPGNLVVSLRFRADELPGIEREELIDRYAEAVRDTPFENTALNIETIAAEAVCEQCGNKFRFDEVHDCCDKCGSLRLELHGVDELCLDSVVNKE
jgi:Zn finger protein HypA/HybF involved in hydrogenase expression